MSDIKVQKQDARILITLPDRLNTRCVERNWLSVFSRLRRLRPETVTVDASALEFLDGAGIALLLYLQKIQGQSQGSFAIEHLKPELQQLLETNSLEGLTETLPQETSFRRVAEDIGEAGYSIFNDLKIQVRFLGELVYKLIASLSNPARIRWKDYFLLAEKAGADAVSITALLGFLIGLILAFQSAVAMRQFGAQVYVADLIVLSMFKEMGPLISAFILASRSGSAYAAELGTMKVNEELDALHTFGMDPVRFLVVPRVLALVTALPLLSLFNILAALFGAQAVMVLVGVSPVIF